MEQLLDHLNPRGATAWRCLYLRLVQLYPEFVVTFAFKIFGCFSLCFVIGFYWASRGS